MFALLEWDGTADAAPANPINDWTSTLYVSGQFFVSNVTVLNVGYLSASQNVWADAPAIPYTTNSGLNNLIYVVWTENVVAQNGTLDLGLWQLIPGTQALGFSRQPNDASGDASQDTVIATGSTAAITLANRFAETYYAQDWGVVSGSSADQSANMQAAITACSGRTLVLPDSDIYCKNLVLPTNGITLIGTRPPYSVSGLGTRLVLPNASNTYIAATYGYVNNTTTSDYGPTIRGVGFEGNKANQTTANPLLILRCSRALIDASVTVEGSKGKGILLTATSATGVAISNSMPENVISARILNCDSEGFYGQDGASNKLADIFLLNVVIGSCGGANQTYAARIERGAGAKVIGGQFYGNGAGNLRIDKFGVGCVIGNNFDLSSMTAAAGTVYNTYFELEGFGSVQHVGNDYGNNLASAGAVTWQHMLITGGVASTRVSNAGNSYRSENFSITAWSYAGNAGGIVNSAGETFYNCWPTQLASSQVYYQDDGAAEGPYQDLIRYSASPAVNDALGAYRVKGYDSNGAEQEYAAIRGVISSPTAGSIGGSWEVYCTRSGTRTLVAKFSDALQIGAAAANTGAGTANVVTAYYTAGTQVVGARSTGWTAFTGATDKATSFDTGTVTLTQLAQRVAALQGALTTHGLIGT